jgi:hypothetical protein
MDLQDVVRLRKAGVEYSEIAKRFEKERVHPAFSEMPGEPGYGVWPEETTIDALKSSTEEFLCGMGYLLLLTSPVWGIYLLVVFVKWVWFHS